MSESEHDPIHLVATKSNEPKKYMTGLEKNNNKMFKANLYIKRKQYRRSLNNSELQKVHTS
jgi:hypothetical protein